MSAPRATSPRARIIAACGTCVLTSMLASTHARAQHAAMAQSSPATVADRAGVDSTRDAPPFASSLQIAPPGPRAEADGMNYQITLTWSARPGAAAYRVFMWTDAVRAWYRTAQVTTLRIDVHAFKSGCTAFIVVAVADPNSDGNALAGLETTNVVRFPLSARPELCPIKAE